jgi:FkbM family methyltransferase
MTTQDPAQRLEHLLAESPESVRARESKALEDNIGSLDQPFLLFGAGHLGRKVLKKLATIGKRPSAFLDNNPRLWGTEVLGVPVLRPADAAQQFDATEIGVITTIWYAEATDRMSDRLSPLRVFGFRRIAMFGHLAWKFQDEFLPHYCLDLPSRVIAAADHIREAFHLLDDDDSRQLYVDHIEWRLFLDYDVLPQPSSELIYFNDRYFSHSEREVLYDIGAYTGDSVRQFMGTQRSADFSNIHAFEPSPNNFNALQAYVSDLGELHHKVSARQLALGDKPGSIQVETENGPSSRVGLGTFTVPMTTVDLFGQTHQAPTLIKIDIEGFEPQCLKGAEQTIRSAAPVVTVSVYHLQAHIWELLLQLHAYQPGYHFSLCPHGADGWDLVLYAVPETRKPSR